MSVHRLEIPMRVGSTWAMCILALYIQGNNSRSLSNCMLHCTGCFPYTQLLGRIAWLRTRSNSGLAFLWVLATNNPRLRPVASCRLRKLPGKSFQTQRKLACRACRKRRLLIRAPRVYFCQPGRASTCCLAIHSKAYPLPRFSWQGRLLHKRCTRPLVCRSASLRGGMASDSLASRRKCRSRSLVQC